MYYPYSWITNIPRNDPFLRSGMSRQQVIHMRRLIWHMNR